MNLPSAPLAHFEPFLEFERWPLHSKKALEKEVYKCLVKAGEEGSLRLDTTVCTPPKGCPCPTQQLLAVDTVWLREPLLFASDDLKIFNAYDLNVPSESGVALALGSSAAWNTELLRSVAERLNSLLCEPSHVFWSHARFDVALCALIGQFLTHVDRPYDIRKDFRRGEWAKKTGIKHLRHRALEDHDAVVHTLLSAVCRVFLRIARELKTLFTWPDSGYRWVENGLFRSSEFNQPFLGVIQRFVDLCSLGLPGSPISAELQAAAAALIQMRPELREIWLDKFLPISGTVLDHFCGVLRENLEKKTATKKLLRSACLALEVSATTLGALHHLVSEEYCAKSWWEDVQSLAHALHSGEGQKVPSKGESEATVPVSTALAVGELFQRFQDVYLLCNSITTYSFIECPASSVLQRLCLRLRRVILSLLFRFLTLHAPWRGKHAGEPPGNTQSWSDCLVEWMLGLVSAVETTQATLQTRITESNNMSVSPMEQLKDDLRRLDVDCYLKEWRNESLTPDPAVVGQLEFLESLLFPDESTSSIHGQRGPPEKKFDNKQDECEESGVQLVKTILARPDIKNKTIYAVLRLYKHDVTQTVEAFLPRTPAAPAPVPFEPGDSPVCLPAGSVRRDAEEKASEQIKEATLRLVQQQYVRGIRDAMREGADLDVEVQVQQLVPPSIRMHLEQATAKEWETGAHPLEPVNTVFARGRIEESPSQYFDTTINDDDDVDDDLLSVCPVQNRWIPGVSSSSEDEASESRLSHINRGSRSRGGGAPPHKKERGGGRPRGAPSSGPKSKEESSRPSAAEPSALPTQPRSYRAMQLADQRRRQYRQTQRDRKQQRQQATS